jgi:outer membrane lipoprotein-sorting protein
MTLSDSVLTRLVCVPLLAGMVPSARAQRSNGKAALDFKELAWHLDQTAKGLQTLSADLAYTTVTVLVDDRSTEYGQLYFRKEARTPTLKIDFQKPDPKQILLKGNTAQVYLPKVNEIQEYDIGKRSNLVEQLLSLGFGTPVSELEKYYEVKLTGEETVEDETAAVLELTPKGKDLAAQLTKVQLWISEESWLPLQQKFFEPSGDYIIARYSAIRVNRSIPPATFRIQAAPGVKRVKMN